MKQLDANWITEGLIDFEYKKYVLLAYLNEVSKNFNENRLYPFLADLVLHYRNLIALKENKQITAKQFPQKLSKIDLENFKMEYEKILHDDNYLQEIEGILDFAIPKIQEHLNEGRELYDFLEKQIAIFPVGVVPLNTDEGYLFVRSKTQREANVYEYTVTIFESADERFRGIRTEFITSFTVSLSHTLEHIKFDLIKSIGKFSNPATYAAESQMPVPLAETLLPIAKRSLLRMISRQD